ncbi:hypothetical protein JIN84_06425 [Luteolibacter yonseiensis]|uniref:Uncharacterized protein n=1 Tax=Luteolibacter yonseiensis TaxID=1144680 RepID=A0A934VAK2_9BACT|nr:hypothetical protein [Luteolibacter yonseiensis]MBK1815240.1 hypothetical protein [Luteolibacter yonseiensis]
MGLWIPALVVAVIFAFGAAVRVDFNDPSVHFSEAVASVRWERALPDRRGSEFQLVFAAAVIGVVFHSIHHSWRVRLGVMAGAFLVPVLTIGPVILYAPVVAPRMIYDMVAGNVDGEFYCEGMAMIAAVGLWMSVCLVFVAREIWLWRKEAKSGAGP